jgi:hypothetical protein
MKLSVSYERAHDQNPGSNLKREREREKNKEVLALMLI